MEKSNPMTTQHKDSREEKLRDEFHDWCMKNPATDAIRLALKLTNSADFWLAKMAEERHSIVERVKSRKRPTDSLLAFSEVRIEEIKQGKVATADSNAGYNTACDDIITDIEGVE